ncbi:MAG: DUF2961 domain-containing protein [candidate division WS1 bacterium]|jgi:hypothetical protein|nr:DUF2961 domain-containing protein [candidate division WS1 bacterium]
MRVTLVTLLVVLTVPVAAQDSLPWQDPGLAGLARIEGFDLRHENSTDPQGKNIDYRAIQPGETLTILDQAGPGRIVRLWCTIDHKEDHHLRKVVLRMYWDGEDEPSINVPLGDFFGLGHAQYYHYVSAVMNAAVGRAMSCFLPMPFDSRARITITNEGEREVRKFYWQIDWQPMVSAPPEDTGRLHACFNRENPTEAAPGTGFDEAYVVLDAKGRGRYMGCVLSVHGLEPEWWGEGDEIIEVDGKATQGTGLEDYFNCAWGFTQPFWADTFGAPFVAPHGEPEKATVYRWHVDDPIFFGESLRIRIEHGSENDRSDDYSSVAYWYQTEPHEPFTLLPVADRLPREFQRELDVELDTESVAIEGAPAIKVDKPRIAPPVFEDEPTTSPEWAALKMVLLAGWLPFALLVGVVWYLRRRKP